MARRGSGGAVVVPSLGHFGGGGGARVAGVAEMAGVAGMAEVAGVAEVAGGRGGGTVRVGAVRGVVVGVGGPPMARRGSGGAVVVPSLGHFGEWRWEVGWRRVVGGA
jgi:hypothetical protein